MKRINKPTIGLDTKVEVELTIRELLNLAVAVSNVPPNQVKKDMIKDWGFTETEGNNIIRASTPYYNNEDLVLFGLANQIHYILKDFGYTRKDYDNEPVPNDY